MSDTTSAWFKYILPMDEEVKAVNEIEYNIVGLKYFSCHVCDYPTNHHNELGKHIRRRHDDQVNVPQSTNQVKCPDCGKMLKYAKREENKSDH